MFAIGFTYTPIAPFIVPWSLAYFLISYLVGKYLLIYVHNPEYDSGGLFWPVLFNRVITGNSLRVRFTIIYITFIGMVVGQLTIIGAFVFKTNAAVALVAPLPIFTLAFAYIMHRLFDRSTTTLALNEV